MEGKNVRQHKDQKGFCSSCSNSMSYDGTKYDVLSYSYIHYFSLCCSSAKFYYYKKVNSLDSVGLTPHFFSKIWPNIDSLFKIKKPIAWKEKHIKQRGQSYQGSFLTLWQSYGVFLGQGSNGIIYLSLNAVFSA